jgi:hypothetical protein
VSGSSAVAGRRGARNLIAEEIRGAEFGPLAPRPTPPQEAHGETADRAPPLARRPGWAVADRPSLVRITDASWGACRQLGQLNGGCGCGRGRRRGRPVGVLRTVHRRLGGESRHSHERPPSVSISFSPLPTKCSRDIGLGCRIPTRRRAGMTSRVKAEANRQAELLKPDDLRRLPDAPPLQVCETCRPTPRQRIAASFFFTSFPVVGRPIFISGFGERTRPTG